MNSHCGITGSCYRPVERGAYDDPPEVGDGLKRIVEVIFAIKCVAAYALYHFWPAIQAVWGRL